MGNIYKKFYFWLMIGVIFFCFISAENPVFCMEKNGASNSTSSKVDDDTLEQSLISWNDYCRHRWEAAQQTRNEGATTYSEFDPSDTIPGESFDLYDFLYN